MGDVVISHQLTNQSFQSQLSASKIYDTLMYFITALSSSYQRIFLGLAFEKDV